jgi:hypothetical protein
MTLGLLVGMASLGAFVGSQAANASTCNTVTVSAADPPPTNLLPIYQEAASQYGLGTNGWAYLAAINKVETDFGQDMSTSSAGAIGWMQFEPSTWAEFAIDVSGSASANPYNPYDAIYSAANMLHADGAPGDWHDAIFAYNHANWYVQEVTKLANSYAQGSTGSGGSACYTTGTVSGATAQISSNGMALAPAAAPAAVQALITAGNEIIGKPYPQPDVHYGPLDVLWPAYDCSGATSYVLYRAGLLGDSALVSGQFESSGASGPGKWITIYANKGHVFIEVAGIVLNTAWYSSVQPSTPDSGPRWQPASTVQAQINGDTHGGFVVRHPVGF